MDKPKGYRDVWWCWALNEPFIIRYNSGVDVPNCQHCGEEAHTTGPTSAEYDWRGEHIFITHIAKPLKIPLE